LGKPNRPVSMRLIFDQSGKYIEFEWR
jgi:hypothetical protein